jgi:hypothetical protein|tara:strand:- start:22245 stop:22514 length:270 start_codon:yes stop_codon:yes gene_type:complete
MSYLITIIISLLIIYLADHLLRYLRDTYTTKKTKDIVGHHIDKYKSMMNEFQQNQKIEETQIKDDGIKLTNSDLIAMHEELDALITDDL